MMKNIAVAILGLLIGIVAGLAFINYQTNTHKNSNELPKKQIIGFLPYWLLEQAKNNYADSLTTLTYFGLNVDGDGHIIKQITPQQDDPGWYALNSGKLDPFLKNAKGNNIKLSLLISGGDAGAINTLVSNPAQHADTLISEIKPLMKQYGFNDLNLDIEYRVTSSSVTETHFTQFVEEIKQQLIKQKLGTLTIEISPNDVIKNNLINTKALASIIDTMILMAYDYHSQGSYVTGPVAPLSGAGVDSESDVTTAVEKALQTIPSGKLILGMPLYGYEWETLNTAVRSAVIPGTGALASDNRMESFVPSCATCSAFFDTEAQEEFIVYKDSDTGTIHQIYFPNQNSIKAKVDFSNKEKLGGVALWALGYEGDTMLHPLKNYK